MGRFIHNCHAHVTSIQLFGFLKEQELKCSKAYLISMLQEAFSVPEPSSCASICGFVWYFVCWRQKREFWASIQHSGSHYTTRERFVGHVDCSSWPFTPAACRPHNSHLITLSTVLHSWLSEDSVIHHSYVWHVEKPQQGLNLHWRGSCLRNMSPPNFSLMTMLAQSSSSMLMWKPTRHAFVSL